MSALSRNQLLQKLDRARESLEEVLPATDLPGQVYPGWTTKDILAHLSGWDDAIVDAFQAHVAGTSLTKRSFTTINAYNLESVSARRHLDYESILKEWRLNRQVVRTMVEQMTEEKLAEPLEVLWGGRVTIAKLVEIIHEHDLDHARDIGEWLKNPDVPHPKTAK